MTVMQRQVLISMYVNKTLYLGIVAILWKKTLNNKVRRIECESDRICVIEVTDACESGSLFVIGIYLPHQTCKITSFTQHVNILSDLIARYCTSGEVIIIGDANNHFSNEWGNRFWGKTTHTAKKLLQVIEAHKLHIIDGNDETCNGPAYTFNVKGVGCSYIDHCICTERLRSNIVSCTVLEDNPLNLSDHLPLSILLNIKNSNITKQNRISPNSLPAWHKLSKQQIKYIYSDAMEEQAIEIKEQIMILNTLNDRELLIVQLEKVLKNIVDCIIYHGNKIPKSKYRKQLKPYWNAELKHLSQQNKQAWNKGREKHTLYF